MLYYFRKYPVSLIIVAIIFYLSFFTPPKTDVEEIPYICLLYTSDAADEL